MAVRETPSASVSTTPASPSAILSPPSPESSAARTSQESATSQVKLRDDKPQGVDSKSEEQNDDVVIVVGTTNPVKLMAVREVIASYPALAGTEIRSFKVDSNVSEQPMTLQQTAQGARNRANAAAHALATSKVTSSHWAFQGLGDEDDEGVEEKEGNHESAEAKGVGGGNRRLARRRSSSVTARRTVISIGIESGLTRVYGGQNVDQVSVARSPEKEKDAEKNGSSTTATTPRISRADTVGWFDVCVVAVRVYKQGIEEFYYSKGSGRAGDVGGGTVRDSHHLGMSCSFQIPPRIMHHVLNGKDLSQASYAAGITRDKSLGSGKGLIGILTRGRIDRLGYTRQAISCAMIGVAGGENPGWY